MIDPDVMRPVPRCRWSRTGACRSSTEGAEACAEGRAEGELALLKRIIEQTLGRPLTEAERGAALTTGGAGSGGVSERALLGPAGALAQWLSSG